MLTGGRERMMGRRSGLHWTLGTGRFEGRRGEAVFVGGRVALWVRGMICCESRAVELEASGSTQVGAGEVLRSAIEMVRLGGVVAARCLLDTSRRIAMVGRFGTREKVIFQLECDISRHEQEHMAPWRVWVDQCIMFNAIVFEMMRSLKADVD